jgi:hypothetical protein
VVAPFKHEITALTKVLTNLLFKIFGEKVMTNVLDKLRASLPKYYSRLPSEFGEEIAGIAAATDIDPSIIFIYNIFYTVFGVR